MQFGNVYQKYFCPFYQKSKLICFIYFRKSRNIGAKITFCQLSSWEYKWNSCRLLFQTIHQVSIHENVPKSVNLLETYINLWPKCHSFSECKNKICFWFYFKAYLEGPYWFRTILSRILCKARLFSNLQPESILNV